MVDLDFRVANFYSEIDLPASKSIHNRLLILNALYDLDLNIGNPSDSEDTVLLAKLLKSENNLLNCENAGTVFRFLTAYVALGKKTITLTGSERMLKRPVGDLVNALKELGADIEYYGETGFPPIIIRSGKMHGGIVNVKANISSQFISALVMLGPKLKGGLIIQIDGEISSAPYIEMTVKLMQDLGFELEFKDHEIIIKPFRGKLKQNSVIVEPDWSAAAFWFQIVAMAKNGKVLLKDLNTKSLQGDAILAEWAGLLGIKLKQLPEGILVEKDENFNVENSNWNFTNYPDLAPSVVVLLSVFKGKASFIGLDSLKIKESDRTKALQIELKKCDVNFIQTNDGWVLDATHFNLIEGTQFENYADHRMAMALGTLAFIKPIKMKNIEVAGKSYPLFWKHLGGLSVGI